MTFTATRFTTDLRTWLFGATEDEESPLGRLGTLAMVVVDPVAAMLLPLGVARRREFLADATGAHLLGEGTPLADAPAAIERSAALVPMRVNPAHASLSAVNPLPRAGLVALFLTHPPTAERIRRLRALSVCRVRPLAYA